MPVVRVKHINTIRKKSGAVYHFHRITGERLPDDPESRIARALAINAQLAETKKAAAGGVGTMKSVISDYRAAPEYKGLADKTRRDYGRYLTFLENEFGEDPVRELMDREFVLGVRDLFHATPRKADMTVRMLSILFEFAMERPRQYRLARDAVNPCTRMRKLYKSDGGFEPWPDAVQDAFFKAAYAELRDVVESTLYLGQRGGDMVRVSRAHMQRGRVQVVQEKTGEPLWIKMHDRFREILDGMEDKGNLIVFTTKEGHPWKVDHLRHELRKVMTSIGHEGYSLHGLRKNAVINLLECGCTEAQTAAVTGQTLQMVQYYARKVNQQKLADAAITKLNTASRRKARKKAK